MEKKKNFWSEKKNFKIEKKKFVICSNKNTKIILSENQNSNFLMQMQIIQEVPSDRSNFKMSTNKRDYNEFKKAMWEGNPQDHALNNSFKRMKLIENNVIIQKMVKPEKQMKGTEDANEIPRHLQEKTTNEYESNNVFLRNTYLEYLYRCKDQQKFMSENKQEIKENDVTQKIYDFYRDEKMRLYFARMEFGQKMQLE